MLPDRRDAALLLEIAAGGDYFADFERRRAIDDASSSLVKLRRRSATHRGAKSSRSGID
jgi:hypothetical protein